MTMRVLVLGAMSAAVATALRDVAAGAEIIHVGGVEEMRVLQQADLRAERELREMRAPEALSRIIVAAAPKEELLHPAYLGPQQRDYPHTARGLRSAERGRRGARR